MLPWDGEVPSHNQKMMHSRVAKSGKSDHVVTKLKTCRSLLHTVPISEACINDTVVYEKGRNAKPTWM